VQPCPYTSFTSAKGRGGEAPLQASPGSFSAPMSLSSKAVLGLTLNLGSHPPARGGEAAEPVPAPRTPTLAEAEACWLFHY